MAVQSPDLNFVIVYIYIAGSIHNMPLDATHLDEGNLIQLLGKYD